MSDLVRARVEEHLVRLRLGSVATRLDAILSDAARKEPSYLAFLDSLLGEELDAKQKKRVAMGIQIAHFPVAKTLETSTSSSSRRSTRSWCASWRRDASSRPRRTSCSSGRLASARRTWLSRGAHRVSGDHGGVKLIHSPV